MVVDPQLDQPRAGQEQLRAGQVAEAAGVNRETLRYYERRRLLARPARSPGGHRLYSAESVTTLRVIKAAQRLGFTLDEVADLLRIGQHRHHQQPASGLQRQARAKLAEVDRRIEDLQAIRATLIAAIEAGCDELTSCVSSDCCPIPFADLGPVSRGSATRPPARGAPTTSADRHPG
ncbi:MAG: MerR family transcriptional regulator [Nocardioides sp.]